MDWSNNNTIYTLKDEKEVIIKLKMKKYVDIKIILRNLTFSKYADVIIGYNCITC